jgi:3-oxoacyl-[acyl-carrier-protein] synthase II
MKRVVVSGIGAVTPIGNNISEYNTALQKGVSGAGPITRFDASLFKTRFACEVKGLNMEDFIEKKEIRRMDLFSQFAMVCTDEAYKDARLGDFIGLDLDRAGVIWGSGIGGLRSLEAEIEEYARGNGTPRFNPFMIPKMISDIAPGLISIKYGWRGINYGTVSACASSTHAMMNAFDYIRTGRADIIITGGSEAAITAAGMGGFNATKALSERNDDYLTASRPFDLDRDGFVLGEGGGCLIFEDLEHAQRRGAKIYCEVMGAGATADAYHITAPHPEGLGANNVMRMALKDGNIQLDEVDYINVHGTSTPLGDIAETKAIIEVFGDHAFKLNVSSTKSMTGHLLGGAGAIESIASILAIQHQYIPPTINHFTDDPAINSKLNLTFNAAQKREVRVALSNTFGFGGHNGSIIFKKYE